MNLPSRCGCFSEKNPDNKEFSISIFHSPIFSRDLCSLTMKIYSNRKRDGGGKILENIVLVRYFVIRREVDGNFFPAYKNVPTISIKNYFSMIFYILLMKWFLREASERKLFSCKMNFLIQWILFLVNFLRSRRPILLAQKTFKSLAVHRKKMKANKK